VDILVELQNYIANALSLSPGTSIIRNEMPDSGTKCICITEPKEAGHVLPQIDAEKHYIKITARDALHDDAKELAKACYMLLRTEDGVVSMPNLTVFVELQGTPIWEKTDQQNRKYYYFTLKAITKVLT